MNYVKTPTNILESTEQEQNILITEVGRQTFSKLDSRAISSLARSNNYTNLNKQISERPSIEMRVDDVS